VTETNTVDRFAASGARRGIPEAEIRAWCDAFEYIQLLRLREQHRKAASGEGGGAGSASNPAPNPNRVPLAELADLDRRILKEAMRQVRKLQQRLELDYPG
jgi:CBS domain-containing protein